VEYYRKVIDNYYTEEKSSLGELEERAIATFSRGYTNAYLKPSKDDEMFARTSSGVKGSSIDEIREETKDKIREFSGFRRNKLNFDLTLKVGEQAVLKAMDGKNTVVVKSEEACETSLKNAATDEMIHEQLGKLGNSIYELDTLNIYKEENVFIRKSTLNQLRRDASDLLYEKGSVHYNRTESEKVTADSAFPSAVSKKEVKPSISLKINGDDEIYLADRIKVKRLYVPYDLNMESVKNIDVEEKYLYLPNIVSKEQYDIFKKNMKQYEEIFDGVLVNNAGSFYFFSENSSLKLHCGPFFNIINSFSASLLKERGAEGFTFSVEANIRDMESMRNSTMKTEIAAHEYVQLMVMKNCPMSLMKNCKNMQDCNVCSYRNKYSLKDRKGVYFN